MVQKPYSWSNGATLEEHSKRKHKILREYFFKYLSVRCKLPQQSKFRLAVVDGFAGGGRYGCGAPGSPLIFIEELRHATEEFNLRRKAEGMAKLDIECSLILADADPAAIRFLKSNVEPLLAAIKAQVPELHLRVEFHIRAFNEIYPQMKTSLTTQGYRNVIFNLDQCGHTHVPGDILSDIMGSFFSAEIFHTFLISSLLAFLQKRNPGQLRKYGLAESDTLSETHLNSNAWLGAAERLVFESFRKHAAFVSPFSINNPDGWRYWLLHFSNSYRARQEFNNVLHNNSSMQAHFGRSGLHMLHYDPSHEGNTLYLFDPPGRVEARDQLLADIPRLLTDFGDAVGMADFYRCIYNMTPAHMDDIHHAMIDNPDVEVLTTVGGERRKAGTIESGDMLRLKRQTSFFPLLQFGTPSRRP